MTELEKQLEAETGFKAALEEELQGTKDSSELMTKRRRAAEGQVWHCSFQTAELGF